MPRLSRRTCLKAASCATALSFFGAARAAENANAKLLTVYFSWSGSSKTVAEEVRRLAGGDILRLETVEPYPAEYRATTERAKKEREANARPPLKTALPDLLPTARLFSRIRFWAVTCRCPCAPSSTPSTCRESASRT